MSMNNIYNLSRNNLLLSYTDGGRKKKNSNGKTDEEAVELSVKS